MLNATAAGDGCHILNEREKITMKTYQAVTLAMLAGFGLGAAVIQGLHAQAKPPGFYIAMNDVTDRDNYINEFSKKSTAISKAAGGHFLVQGGQATGLKGEAPKSRIVIIQFDSMDKLLAWFKSPENTDAQKIADKYATVHSFAVEGVAQ
jgi:uncharacterized protein (DUF1330 family)